MHVVHRWTTAGMVGVDLAAGAGAEEAVGVGVEMEAVVDGVAAV